MKKLFFTLAIVTASLCSYGQRINAKLKSKQSFVVVPAVTVTSDSMTVASIVDDGSTITAHIVFYGDLNKPAPMTLVLWQGAEYAENQTWTRAGVLSRIKFLLNIR